MRGCASFFAIGISRKEKHTMAEAEVTSKIEPLTFFFRKLSVGEKRKWRKSAREQYEPFSPIDGMWHPVYQAECVAMNDESATYVYSNRQAGGSGALWITNFMGISKLFPKHIIHNYVLGASSRPRICMVA